MKSLAALVAILALGAVIATSAVASSPRHASVTIRHQVKGCHVWTVGSGAYAAHADAKLAVGGSITFTDNDLMSHQLIKKAGPAIVFSGSHVMNHIGATLKVTFPHAGTYRFTTKAGEDYMKGVKTIGEDNVLTLTVTVR
jgi:plastocyanin